MGFSVTIVDETKKSDICKDQCECCKMTVPDVMTVPVMTKLCRPCMTKTTLSVDNPGTINSQKVFLLYFFKIR